MSEKQHTIIYNAEDIQHYLEGRLTPLQMNAMEKAALDDPFLADAMEGYEGMPSSEWKGVLADAKQQFAEKGSGAKIIAMPIRKNNWLKIGAAILLIGGTSSIVYFIFNKKEQPQIAKIEPAAIPENSNNSIPETSRVTVIPSSPENRLAENNIIQKRTPRSAAAGNLKTDSSFIYQPSSKKTDEIAVAGEDDLETSKKAQATATNVAASPPAQALSWNSNSNSPENKALNKTVTAGQEVYYDKTAGFAKTEGRKDQPFNHNFYAQVMAPDNTPLPFANISIKSENFGTYTDVKGNFRLASADSVLTVEVKSVGYIPKIYTIKSNLQQNKITLVEEDMAAKEKTVINGYASVKAKTSRRATLVKDSVINVEPADGWDNYNTYVTNNIEIPDELINNNIHGQVELSFDVTANGSITNIKVDRSLCNNCDEVARRLIELGPQWKVKKGKKGKGKITLQF